MVPKTERLEPPTRAAASAEPLPCIIQAHRPITAKPATPAATEASPTRTKTSRPPLVPGGAPPGAPRPQISLYQIRELRRGQGPSFGPVLRKGRGSRHLLRGAGL